MRNRLSDDELRWLAETSATHCTSQAEADELISAASGRYHEAMSTALRAAGFAVPRRCASCCAGGAAIECMSQACDQGDP